MADSILRLKVESQEYDNKLKQATNGLTRYIDECRKVGGTLGVVEKDTLDYVRALGQMDTTSRTATGKLAEMKKAFVELSTQYKQMSDAEKQSPFGKALAESLDQLKGRIGESKAQLDDINKSINGGGGLTGALDNMLGKVGLNVEGLMKFGGAAGVATTALKVAKDAFFASETSLDEWGRTVQSSQSLYQGFLSALNNSDISGFLSRMDEIVSAARDAYNAMDELGTFSAFQQRNVAKGRAGYAQALDEYRLNPTSDNKQKLAQANQKVMNDLRESHDKTEAAYQAALRQIATERIKGKDMQDAFVKMFSEGSYGDLQAAKSSYSTGRLLNSGSQYYYGDRVYDGSIQDRSTGKWRDMSATEKQQFEFARALSQVNDSQIKEVQALGAQSVAITEQIYQQDRAYNRLAGNNTPLKGGGSGGGGTRGGGTSGGGKGGKTEIEAAIGSIDYQTKKVQELQKAWRAAADDNSREKIKKEIEEQQYALDRMTGKETFDPSKMTALQGVSVAKRSELELKLPDVSKQKQEIQLELKTEAVKVDETTLHNLMKDAIQNGINGMDFNFATLGEKIGRGIDVPDTEWQKIVDEYNALREKLGLEPIKLKLETGGLEEAGKDANTATKDFQKAASAIGSVGSALSSIEDPSAKVAGIVAQAIATVASAFAGALHTDGTTKSNIWAFIGAAAASTATMISTIASIHSATGYAQGGQIKGNSYSGDNILGMVDGGTGGFVGLNAGEIVLNQAQTANVANALEGSGMRGIELSASVSGEQILLVANRTTRRQGRGELVTWK